MSVFKQLWGRPRVRITVLGCLVLAGIILLVYLLVGNLPKGAGHVYGNDYSQYWCAARALVMKTNPFDPTTCFFVVQAPDPSKLGPVLTWNPPYTMALTLPYAALPFDMAVMVWMATNVLLATGCGAALWRLFAPKDDKRYWIGVIVALAYMPTLQTIKIGQISLWLLAGITGFLVAVRFKRDYIAGIALALLAIKPHIPLLFLAGITWWVLRERHWKIPLAALATVAAASVLVTFISPQVFGQYLNTFAQPPLYWYTTTMGNWLRVLFGFKYNWLQYLPTIIGLGLFLIWLLRRKGRWEWLQVTPGLLLASIIFAAYGWPIDQVILLPAVVVYFSRLQLLYKRQCVILVTLYVLTQLGMLIQNQTGINAAYYYWFPLAFTGLYTWQQWMVGRFGTQAFAR